MCCPDAKMNGLVTTCTKQHNPRERWQGGYDPRGLKGRAAGEGDLGFSDFLTCSLSIEKLLIVLMSDKKSSNAISMTTKVISNNVKTLIVIIFI